ncbi:hypothetical protein GGF41_007724, partial [Coemansia sp. RSA 2531]
AVHVAGRALPPGRHHQPGHCPRRPGHPHWVGRRDGEASACQRHHSRLAGQCHRVGRGRGPVRRAAAGCDWLGRRLAERVGYQHYAAAYDAAPRRLGHTRTVARVVADADVGVNGQLGAYLGCSHWRVRARVARPPGGHHGPCADPRRPHCRHSVGRWMLPSFLRV